ncbi:MAG TPA: MoxR family ATPase [Candidatus Binatia bacterium]|nr:MoxR family ATPase [Candidatus Binatia bacterium]
MIAAKRPSTVVDAVAHTIVGQREVVESLILGLIAGGHILLEGVPGLAKTLACRALAAAIGGEFKRIQFTPDLLPSDIIGTRIFDQRTATFSTVRGPIFANVVLADEINRAPAKVQSALLEGMQERQATIGPESLAFPVPFIVLATMNPLDTDGTYALPLAQMDRFLMKILVSYPSRDEELAIVERFGADVPAIVRDVAGPADIIEWQAEARRVHIEPSLREYVVEIVRATRDPRASPYFETGASPRASLALVQLARARALLEGREFAIPDDVRRLAPAVLRHRVQFGHRLYADGLEAEDVIARTVGAVRAP